MFAKCRSLSMIAIIYFSYSSYALADSISSIPDIADKIWYQLSVDDKSNIDKINKLIKGKNYKKAENICLEFKRDKSDKEDNYYNYSNNILLVKKDFSNAICQMIAWYKYSDESNFKNISLAKISDFIKNNKSLYNIEDIKKTAAKVIINNKMPYEDIAQFFSLNPPLNKDSRLYLLQAKIDFFNNNQISESGLEKINQEISQEVAKIWIEENFTNQEGVEFLQKFRSQLGEKDHISRISRLIMDDRISEAQTIFSLVNEDYQKLFKAASDISINKRYINNLILSVPRKLRSHEALLYRRALWYKENNEKDDIVELLLDLPQDLAYPGKWWGLRRLYARELLKTKDYEDSYDIISNHNLPTSHKKYWEAQWTSGWIALRFLNESKKSYKHFLDLYNNVSHPVSLARASYWLGRSMEERGKKSLALKWYSQAANYPTYFYGQVAISKYHSLIDDSEKISINLPDIPKITSEDLLEISNSHIVQMSYILLTQGKISQASDMLEGAIMNSKTKGQIAIIMKMVNKFSNRALEVKLARSAAKKNVFFIEDSFQILDEIKEDPNSPLIHAIIRQESGFAREALSSAGAVGFMQVMPETAKLVAKEMGLRYDRRKLSSDIGYNIKIGSHYIKKLVDRFDGFEMLAIAAYNAGPNNALRWIDEFYDPRLVGNDIDKVIDWVELITYYETRNYVQRIMENVIVYKYLLSQD